jgi:hypothetical protein
MFIYKLLLTTHASKKQHQAHGKNSYAPIVPKNSLGTLDILLSTDNLRRKASVN